MNEGTQVGVLLGQVEIYELGLHLCETIENVGTLVLDVTEDQQAFTVVVELEVLPQLEFHLIVKNDLLVRTMVKTCDRPGTS